MTKFLIITGVFAGLAMLAEIVYTVCRIAYEKHQAKMSKSCRTILYIGFPIMEKEPGIEYVVEDLFDLGIENEEIDVVKFGDEE